MKVPRLALFGLLATLAAPGLRPAQQREGKTPDREGRAAEFVDRLAAGDYAAATEHFDATMRKMAPPAKLAIIWKSALARLGAFQARTGLRRETSGPYELVFVACRFAHKALDIKVVFNRHGEIAGFFYVPHRDATPYQAPAYVDRQAFRELEVAFGEPSWRLPGTLSLPEGDGPFPAVVLVHGSGPNDRDETLGPNLPFRDIAWGLASRGIAVLRYDKRTKVHGPKMAKMNNLTVREETVDDALLAVKLLRGRDEVDAEKVFVLGHSLGGMLVPRIAARGPDIAGFLVLAGPTRPLEDLIVEQVAYIFSLDGTISAAERKKLEDLKQKVARVKSPDLAPDTARRELPAGTAAPYWLDLRGYRPAEAARRLDRPLLILQGERDYQVTRADFDGWKKALDGRTNVTTRLFPALNHLFIRGEGRSTPAEYRKAGHVDAEVIATIAGWIKRIAGDTG